MWTPHQLVIMGQRGGGETPDRRNRRASIIETALGSWLERSWSLKERNTNPHFKRCLRVCCCFLFFFFFFLLGFWKEKEVFTNNIRRGSMRTSRDPTTFQTNFDINKSNYRRMKKTSNVFFYDNFLSCFHTVHRTTWPDEMLLPELNYNCHLWNICLFQEMDRVHLRIKTVFGKAPADIYSVRFTILFLSWAKELLPPPSRERASIMFAGISSLNDSNSTFS